ncbi:MAG: hypothetical protein ACYDBB_21685 [Armatimonadota bacterium]
MASRFTIMRYCALALLLSAALGGWAAAETTTAPARTPVLRTPATTAVPRVPATVINGAQEGVRASGAALLAKTLTLLPEHATLENCKYTTTDMKNVSGNGTLRLRLSSGGRTFDSTLPAIFRGLVVEPKGAKVTQIVTMVLGAGTLNNFLGAGFRLEVTGGSVSQQNGGLQLGLSGKITTPYQNADGYGFGAVFSQSPAAITCTVKADGSALVLAVNGTQPVKPSAMVIAPLPMQHFVAGGLAIYPQKTDIRIESAAAGPAAFSLTCKTGMASSQLPNVLTVDGYDLPLQFTNMTVNDAGEVTAQQMSLASTGRVDVPLANPANFMLGVSKAEVSMVKNAITNFVIEASPILPQNLLADDGGMVVLPTVRIDMLKDPVVDYRNPPRPPMERQEKIPSYSRKLTNATMTPRGIVVEETVYATLQGYRFALRGLVLDLSRTKAPDAKLTPAIGGAAWQGVYARSVSVTLPEIWRGIDPKTGKATLPVTLPVKDCFIDSYGLSAEINASGEVMGKQTLGGFQANIKGLQLVFGRNSITFDDCRGTVKVFDDPIDLIIDISNGGAAARVEKPATVTNDRLGVAIAVTDGALQPGPDQKYALWVNGALSINAKQCPSLSGSALGFHQLGIKDTGDFVTVNDDGWLPLDTPVTADFDLFRANLSSVSFRKLPSNKWALDLNGEVSLNSDIPVSGTVSTQTFCLVEDAASTDAKPVAAALDIKQIAFDADVEGIIGLSAVLDMVPNGPNPHLRGKAELILLFLGDSALDAPGAKFECYIGKQNVWAVAGSFTLGPDLSIPLGNSGLGLNKFTGGIAHNMVPKSTESGDHTAAGLMGDFGSVDDLVAKPGLGNWLFTAGCGIVLMSSPPAFHAEGRLTIDIPAFRFNIHGDGWIMTNSYERPAQLVVDVSCDPRIPAFGASAAVDLGLPNPDVLHLQGALSLYIAPDDAHLDIGWPYPDNAVSAQVLGGIINGRAGAHITPLGTTVSAGASFNYWIFKGSLDASFGYSLLGNPLLDGSIWASGEVDFYVASLCAAAALHAQVYPDRLWFDGSFRAKVNMPWPVPDFGVSVGYSDTIYR